eukprot:gene851-4123_t
MVQYLETLESFDEAIASDSYVIIDFTASWCGPCRMIGPVFEKLAESHPNVKCFKVDVDNNSDAAAKAQIRAMPTFKVYKNGEVVKELTGASQDALEKIFSEFGGSA